MLTSNKASVCFCSHSLSQVQAQVIQETIVPKEPPPEFEFIADPPSISAFDLDVVKLTAQFVARNGRQFLTQLMQKEQRNYQFDFLRPQHSLFNYFTKLVEQYTKVLGQGEGDVSMLGVQYSLSVRKDTCSVGYLRNCESQLNVKS